MSEERQSYATPALEIAPNEPYQPPSVAGTETLETLKASGISSQVVREALDYVQNGSAHSAQDLEAIDAADRGASVAELDALWGKDRQSNVAALNSFLNDLPSGDAIRNSRTADGRAVLNDPANVQRLLGLARQPRPSAKGDVGEQIAAIEGFMRSNRGAYNKDEALQARYRELLSRREGT